MKKIYMTFIVTFLLSVSLVNAESRLEAIQSMEKAEDDIREMIEAGIGTAFVNDTLIEAKKALNATDYSLVSEKTQLISQTKSKAYNISDSITALQLGIDEVEKLELNASKARELLNKTIIAFKNERYEEAENFISQTYTELGNVRAEATLVKTMIRATRENIASFVKDNWKKIVVATILLAAAGYFASNKIIKIKIKNKIKSLEIENDVLIELMKKAQSDFFQKKTISRGTYEIKMKKYKKRMIEIKEILPVLQARIEGKKEMTKNK